MRNAQILHGSPDADEFLSDLYPSPSNSHWIPWLQKEFLKNGIQAQTPELPVPYNPIYNDWKTTFEYIPVNEETILVAHSRGAGFLLRWLSENKVRTLRTVLVAPYIDPDREKTTDFFDFMIDPTLSDRTDLHILHSDNDIRSIERSMDAIRPLLLKARYHLFPNYGHFIIQDMKTPVFPELATIALKGTIPLS